MIIQSLKQWKRVIVLEVTQQLQCLCSIAYMTQAGNVAYPICDTTGVAKRPHYELAELGCFSA